MGEEAELALDQAYDDWGAERGPQPKSLHIGDYYKMYTHGDPFSDAELRDVIRKMGDLKEDLRHLGAPFKLPYREILRVYNGLVDYKECTGLSK
jgi:hypothetical protein